MEIRIKKNIFLNFTTQFISLIIPFVLSIYVSRVLDVQLIGRYGYVQSILTYFTIVANFGVTTYGVVKISSCKRDSGLRKKVFWELFLIKLVTSGAALLAYFALIISSRDYSLLLSFGLLNLVGCIFDVSWYYQGKENFLVVFLGTLFPKCLQLLLTILFVKSTVDFDLYVLFAFGSVFLHSFIPFIPAAIACRSPGHLSIRSHLKPTTQMFASAALVSIYTTMDRSMIKWITMDEREVGYYEQAFKIFNISSTLVTVVAQVLSPRVAKIKDDGIEKLRPIFINGFKTSYLFSFPMFVGVFVLAPTIINGLFGVGYEGSVPILRVLSVLPVVVGIGRLIVYIYINPFYKQKFSVYATIVGALTNLVLNVLLCFSFGAFGAAIATLVSEVVVALLNVLYFRKAFGVQQYFRLFWKYFFAAIMMGAVSWLLSLTLSDVNEMLALLIIIPVSAIAYFVFLALLKEDVTIRTVKKFLRIS